MAVMLWTGGCSIMSTTAPVNKIIPFSNVDGPGNRTSIFFQGCNFNCRFCHNPETINLCCNCGQCVSSCPAGALSFSGGRVLWVQEKCVQCDTCLRVCPHSSSPRVRNMTAEEVFSSIKKALPYIDGITVSGGECSLRRDFLLELFPLVRSAGKTCLMDSNGSYDYSSDHALLSCCDGVMLDVKAVDPDWSKYLIGSPPERVLSNLRFLLEAGKLQEVRTVIFPDRDMENEETVRYVAGVIGPACDYKIIRYRPFGVRDAEQRLLGEDTTDSVYAGKYAELARLLGASRAFVV